MLRDAGGALELAEAVIRGGEILRDISAIAAIRGAEILGDA
jgi:hypothetical protein